MTVPCDGCGDPVTRCRCTTDPTLPEDMAHGFHVVEPDADGDYYEEII